MHRILIILFFLFFNLIASGQDAIFSQFYHNPLSTNSALTGIFNGKARVGTSLRSQWYNITPNASFNTKSLYGDLRFNILGDDYFSVGAIIMDDNAGINNIGNLYGHLSLSYSKHLFSDKYSKKTQYLIFGFQVGFGKSYFSDGQFLFGTHFNKFTEKLDKNLNSGEMPLVSRLYPNLNAGLLWYITGRKGSIYLGGNMQHLNRPNVSLIKGGTSKLFMRYTINIGGEIVLENGFSLLPAFNINMQDPFVQTVLGSFIRYEYYKSDRNAFRIGAWTRISNELEGMSFTDIIFSTILEFNKFELGLSYDVSISEMNRINDYKGAFEISLIYIWGDIPVYQSVNCPRF